MAISVSKQAAVPRKLAVRKTPAGVRLLRWLFRLLLVLNVYPLIWLFINSLRTDQELNLRPFALPETLRWSNYEAAWNSMKLGVFFSNSLLISASAVAVTITAGVLASFVLSRFEFRGRNFLLLLFVLGMLIPIHATLVPLYIEMKTLGLLNTRYTLLFPYVAFNLPLVIFILVGFINAIPRELEEAAVMDGAGVMTVFGKVILPLLRPGLVTAAIITFLHNWNELAFALVLISDTDLKTLPLGLAGIAGQHNKNHTIQMAAVSLVLIPTVLFFMLFQKYISEGLVAGAVKT